MEQERDLDGLLAELIAQVREIVKRIEAELDYPGQIKVVLIRETRVTDYAK